MADKEFELLEEHILLLQNMELTFEDNIEYGAPTFDCKRPYGNSGDAQIVRDMAEILGWTLAAEDDQKNPDYIEQRDFLEELHRETATALDIILNTRSFVPGKYEYSWKDKNWKLVT